MHCAFSTTVLNWIAGGWLRQRRLSEDGRQKLNFTTTTPRCAGLFVRGVWMDWICRSARCPMRQKRRHIRAWPELVSVRASLTGSIRRTSIGLPTSSSGFSGQLWSIRARSSTKSVKRLQLSAPLAREREREHLLSWADIHCTCMSHRRLLECGDKMRGMSALSLAASM